MVIICIVRGQTKSATRNFRLEAYIHNHPVTVYVDRPQQVEIIQIGIF